MSKCIQVVNSMRGRDEECGDTAITRVTANPPERSAGDLSARELSKVQIHNGRTPFFLSFFLSFVLPYIDELGYRAFDQYERMFFVCVLSDLP